MPDKVGQIIKSVLSAVVFEYPLVLITRQLGPGPDLFQNAPKPLNLRRLREWMAFDGSDE